MSTPHLSSHEFFARFVKLLESGKNTDHGSVFLEQKRLSYTANEALPPGSGDAPLSDLSPPSPLPVLIRVTNGKRKENRESKIKLSTIVEPANLEAFYLRYTEVCKTGMQGLKKRDRSGKKKAKAKKRAGVPEGNAPK